jgi:hypothetical protein
MSTVDNVEHLNVSIAQAGQYTIRVLGTSVFGGSEKYAVSWFVPEPGSAVLTIWAAAFFFVAHLRRIQNRPLEIA